MIVHKKRNKLSSKAEPKNVNQFFCLEICHLIQLPLKKNWNRYKQTSKIYVVRFFFVLFVLFHGVSKMLRCKTHMATKKQDSKASVFVTKRKLSRSSHGKKIHQIFMLEEIPRFYFQELELFLGIPKAHAVCLHLCKSGKRNSKYLQS